MPDVFTLQPARAPATPTPDRPAGPGRARPGPEDEGRPLFMEQLGIPLNGLPDSLLAELDRLGPTFEGWGRRDDELQAPFFVDVGGSRFIGRTLRSAIARARRARPAAEEDDA